jgi:pilus assembly protein CpaD
MVRFRKFVPVLLIGSTLAACQTGPNMQNPAWYSNRGYYPENQPVVERTNYVLDLATNGSGISGSELDRLNAWFDSLDLRYGDRVYVDDPIGGTRVRADVAKVASSHGLLLSDGAPVTAGSAQAGMARVIVRRSTAVVPNCPNWRQSGMSGGLESTESNYGCATNSNIAAMIANPEDLVRGRDGEPGGDPGMAAKAVTSYRNNTGAGKAPESVSTK